MPTGEETFAELLRRTRDGDRAAAEALARTYEADLRIAARVLLGPALRPHLDSLDLVQSVHRSLLLGVRQDKFGVSTPEQLVALALTVVRRKVARKWRHHRRQRRLSSPGSAPDALDVVLTSLHGSADDPARLAQVRDAIERLYRGLADDDRRLLELRLEGCTTAEAARRTGQTPEALRVRLHRLRKHLHQNGILSEWL
jgi:RNA polymerase sigma factor (sigma-70 family)